MKAQRYILLVAFLWTKFCLNLDVYYSYIEFPGKSLISNINLSMV